MSSYLDLPWGDDMQIHRLPPGKAVAIERAIACDGTTVMLGKDGKIYCPRVRDKASFPINNWNFSAGLLGGLVKLGVLTKDQQAEYKAAADRSQDRRSARYELEYLDNVCAARGIKIASSQRDKLVRATVATAA